MRNRIFGGIGVVWGFVILRYSWISGINHDAPPGYQNGQRFAVVLGLLMFLSGAYYLARGDGDWPWKKKKKKRTTRAIRTPE